MGVMSEGEEGGVTPPAHPGVSRSDASTHSTRPDTPSMPLIRHCHPCLSGGSDTDIKT